MNKILVKYILCHHPNVKEVLKKEQIRINKTKINKAKINNRVEVVVIHLLLQYPIVG